MTGFTRLLVAVGDSAGDAAVRYAARLAVRARAVVTVADVFENVPRFVRPLLPRGWPVAEAVRAHKRANLARHAARARRLGVDPEVVLLTGRPVKALVREVVRGRYDLLLVDASSGDGIEPLRATAARLVRECPRPVLLVRPSRRRRRRPRVLVAVDAGPWRMKTAVDVNPTLFDAVLWFAEHEDGEVHVLHVWAPYDARGEAAFAEGALSAKTKQLIAVGGDVHDVHDVHDVVKLGRLPSRMMAANTG